MHMLKGQDISLGQPVGSLSHVWQNGDLIDLICHEGEALASCNYTIAEAQQFGLTQDRQLFQRKMQPNSTRGIRCILSLAMA